MSEDAMPIRKATRDDLEAILKIYETARGFMRSVGNPTQWGSVYPPYGLVCSDIDGESLFVLEENGAVYGVFAFFEGGDPLYDEIDGEWLNDLPHAAIHRVASSGERRGVLAECVGFCLGISSNLKIDTHRDNSVMRHQLKKLGFTECGTVTLENNEERIAFQLCV